MVGPAKIVRQDRRRRAPLFRNDRRHEIAIARVADCRLEQVAEWQLAVSLRQRNPTGHCAGNRDAVPTALRHRRATVETREGPRRGGPSGRIETDELPTVPEDGEQIRADPVAAWIDEGQRNLGSKPGI